MDQIIAYIKEQIKRPGTIQLLGAGVGIFLIALIMGVSDNTPGFFAAAIGVGVTGFAFVHHWREARLYGTLFAVSLISFPVLILIHNIFDGINQNIGTIPVVNQLLEGFAVISFLGAIFVAPMGMVIGVIAGLFYLIQSKIS